MILELSWKNLHFWVGQNLRLPFLLWEWYAITKIPHRSETKVSATEQKAFDAWYNIREHHSDAIYQTSKNVSVFSRKYHTKLLWGWSKKPNHRASIECDILRCSRNLLEEFFSGELTFPCCRITYKFVWKEHFSLNQCNLQLRDCCVRWGHIKLLSLKIHILVLFDFCW